MQDSLMIQDSSICMIDILQSISSSPRHSDCERIQILKVLGRGVRTYILLVIHTQSVLSATAQHADLFEVNAYLCIALLTT